MEFREPSEEECALSQEEPLPGWLRKGRRRRLRLVLAVRPERGVVQRWSLVLRLCAGEEPVVRAFDAGYFVDTGLDLGADGTGKHEAGQHENEVPQQATQARGHRSLSNHESIRVNDVAGLKPAGR